MTNQLSLKDLPPDDILQAAQKVSRWFAEQNITEWKLDGCQSRNDDPLAAAAPELVEALKQAAMALDLAGLIPGTDYWQEQGRLAAKKARSTLFKATGQAS